jgi:hypothetical protein
MPHWKMMDHSVTVILSNDKCKVVVTDKLFGRIHFGNKYENEMESVNLKYTDKDYLGRYNVTAKCGDNHIGLNMGLIVDSKTDLAMLEFMSFYDAKRFSLKENKIESFLIVTKDIYLACSGDIAMNINNHKLKEFHFETFKSVMQHGELSLTCKSNKRTKFK